MIPCLPTDRHSLQHCHAGAHGRRQRTYRQPLCRRLDTKGFPDFKLHLAQSPANGTPYVNRNVEEDDSVDSYTSKIFESVMASPDTVKANLDIAAINRAVDLLTRAKDLSAWRLRGGGARRDEQIFPLQYPGGLLR